MASSPSSSHSTPAFSSRPWKYNVCLSFSAEDTSETFIDPLYRALEQKGIYTYKHDAAFMTDESIESLKNAMEESQTVVIVFTENYTRSMWCLDQLAYIMRRKDMIGQKVFPIFYDIEPSEVQQPHYNVLDMLVKERSDKLESRRRALEYATKTPGFVVRRESNRIREIVDRISDWFYEVPSPENLIEMDARIEEFKSKLQIGVNIIGIVGVEGGGKTALASSFYDQISREFHACCFVENIRERSSKINGLEDLQTQIISDVTKRKKVRVVGVAEGRSNISKLLSVGNVLIVLDDVDHVDQLQALAGDRHRYNHGTRIIITTRDEHLLSAYKEKVIHNIRLLNDKEAINVFLKHASWCCSLGEDYEQVSKDVVSYARGIPLALTVLGSFLCGKDINEWRSALARWKEIPDGIFHISDWVKKLGWIDLSVQERVQAASSWPNDFLSRVLKEQKRNKELGRLKIPLDKLKLITLDFSKTCRIAKGEYGLVYKAQYENCTVAIKRLDKKRSSQGATNFNMEIMVLSAYAHKNVVSLVGFCDQGDEKILVYEYESNGSLDEHIPRKDLTWIQRLQICLGAARGLMYLHDGVGTQHRILHCDIKSANILLDEKFTAKITDFGLSKIGPANVPNTLLISRYCGTPGYTDPEYISHGFLTQKSDVYSFGVVMFEVLCKKMVSKSMHLGDTFSADLVQKRKLDEIIDPHLREQMNSDSLSTFSTIAYQCLKCPAKERPTMSEVVKQLEKALVYQQDISLE